MKLSPYGCGLASAALCIVLNQGAVAQPQDSDDAARRSPQAAFGHIPLSFEANRGQADERVKFTSRGPGYNLFLTPTEIVLSLRSPSNAADADEDRQAGPHVVRMRLIDANPQASVTGTDPLPGTVNYFRGQEPADWHTGIPTYARVRYEDIYPGIDLLFYDNRQQLEFDFVVAAGADPDDIRFSFTGAEAVEVDEEGNILLVLPGGELKLRAPVIYQEVDGIRREVQGTYAFREADVIGFQLSDYDSAQALVVDPILEYSTYFGGNRQDVGRDIALDELGNIYIFGTTSSTDFPTVNPLQAGPTAFGDVFITKLDPSGARVLFSTYLGGNGVDGARGGGPAIAVDADQNVYVTGETSSTGFPTTPGVLQPGFANDPTDPIGQRGRDLFIAKLNASGDALIYSTYLGGSDDDTGGGLAVDASGSVYIAGTTNSDDFPTSNPFQSARRGVADGVVAKLNATASSLVYSTYLGGSDGDIISGAIAVDADGNAYIAGTTYSADFPTANPLQSSLAGRTDAFVTKISPDGASLVYSTYLGGDRSDGSFGGIFVDDSGSVYVTGDTRSDNFPTVNAFQASRRGRTDAFVAKFNPDGSSLEYSTYLGGSNQETRYGLSGPVVDEMGNAYLTGETRSPNFPTVNAFQTSLGGVSASGPGDAFVTALDATGSELLFSSYLGGTGGDSGLGIALDNSRNVYLIGATSSPNFPVVDPIQPTLRSRDAFVVKINPTQQENVNGLVAFQPDASSYAFTANASGCPAGFTGKFSFEAQLDNISNASLSELQIRIAELSNDNQVLTTSGNTLGVGGLLPVPEAGGYADGVLAPNDHVDVPFTVCLTSRRFFRFHVDVVGQPL